MFARAKVPLTDPTLVRSISGQFIATGVPSTAAGAGLAARPEIATNADFVRLEPALLAVSAERIKASLRRELDLNPNAPWRGEIFLALHPAQSTDETLPSSPNAPPAAGIIKSGCPTSCRAPVSPAR